MPAQLHLDHGNHCSCRFLAAAVGCDPQTIRFEFCKNVLMRRWHVECNHGCFGAMPATAKSDRWKDVGPIDPIKAILIHEAGADADLIRSKNT